MDRKCFEDKLSKISEIVCISEFGSYRSEYWIKDRSDIDLIIVVAPGVVFMDTLNIEESIETLSKSFYKYDKIHLTFVLFSDFKSRYSRFAVDSDIKFIINEDRWYDFQHYVMKFSRNNEQFERTLKIDEQYSYFGGIIDESIL
ncbi:MAG: nucleotidyltransferase domain-containing protein [Clostridium sp.]